MSSPFRLVVAFVAAVLLLSACGSSATTIGDTDSAAAASTPAEIASNDTAAPAPGKPTGSLTLSTGETFALSVRSCETQTTDPNSLLNENFFDLSGDTAGDEYYFSINSAQSAESPDPERVIGGLTGERDENGVNPKIDYLVQGTLADNPEVAITVDGARVSGDVLLDSKFSSNKAFGDTVTATFEFNCG